MAFCYIILYVFTIYISLLNYVVTMDEESISGGSPAQAQQFTYQVAIVAKPYESDSEGKLICGGGFIAENLIVTAAHCFVNNYGNLKRYQYSIVSDTIHWKLMNGVDASIVLIYLPSGGNYYLNNIAVAKLQDGFNVTNYTGLSFLNIPDRDELFYGKTGIIAGYGSIFPPAMHRLIWIRNSVELITGFLTFAKVKVTNRSVCGIGLSDARINWNKQFCGVMVTEKPSEKSGICENDDGSPLVYKNKLVGIATKNNINCDDTYTGNIYIKVSTYAPFIKSIIDGNPLPGTVVRRSEEHAIQPPIESFTSLAAAAA